jgi:hypothetical protein
MGETTMRKIIDLQDDRFQAHCALDYLQSHLEEGGTIRHVRDDLVTIDLPDGSETTINLDPVQSLLTALRGMK